MKNIVFISIILLGCFSFLNAQDCNTDNHSANLNDGWSSCSIAPSPNNAHPDGHWVMYDLGFVYAIKETHFWNYNVTGNINKGMKDIIIDYSLDGNNWTNAAQFQLGQASGISTYVGESGPDLTGIQARYILIYASSNWGNSCTGLAEVKFDVDPVTVSDPDIYADEMCIQLFPNPVQGFFTIQGILGNYQIHILNQTGQLYQTLNGSSNEVRIDVSALPSGTYFVQVVHGSNQNLCVQQIIKI